MSARVTIPLILEPQPEGGFTVTSPILPGLVSEGESVEESIENTWDAFLALPVIPELRITAQGLFDVHEQCFLTL